MMVMMNIKLRKMYIIILRILYASISVSISIHIYIDIYIHIYINIMRATIISISISIFYVIFSIAPSLITIRILFICLPHPTTFVTLVVRCLLGFASFICSVISIHEVHPILFASILFTLIFFCISLIGLSMLLTFVLPIFQP